MRRTNKIILISLLISLLLLGIGYAAIQNITLTISGTAEVKAKADNFNVRFWDIEYPTESDRNFITAEITDDVNATVKVEKLSEAGETVSAIYKIKNDSADLSADLSVSTTNNQPEYLTISSQLEKTSLVAGEETTVLVTVTVTKTPITDNITANIGVELIAMPVQPGEEGTSDGINDSSQTPESNGRNKYGYYYDRFYFNQDNRWGIMVHADHSVEAFELMTKEDYPILEKDEWFCVEYLEPGEANHEEAIEKGIIVKNEGKTLVDTDGTEFIMSDIVPHGMHIGNKYSHIKEDGSSNTYILLEDRKTMNMITYDKNGNITEELLLEDFFTPKANGYTFVINGEILISFNITGDLMYIIQDQIIISLEEIHNYVTQTIEQVTCKEEGLVEYICTDCNDSYTITLKPLNHKYDNDTNGYCDECNEVIQYDDTSYNLAIWILVDGDKHNSNPVEVVIPECFYIGLTRNWGRVIAISQNAFEGATNLKSVVIPDTVTSIGKGAFEDCYSLETVNFTGTKEQWESIEIAERNDILNNVTINYNYIIPNK